MGANGFENMAKQLSDIKINQAVAVSALEQAADFYLKRLLPRIPESKFTRKHARQHIHVKISGDEVHVAFDDEGWYWFFPENGTIHQKAQHFARGTYQQNRAKIEQIMQQKIIAKMKG